MIGVHDFIIKSDFEFAKTFVTEGGLELHADVRFSAERLANRIATVLELPLALEDCEIKSGYQVMVDPTIFYQQDYVIGGVTENNFMIDRINGIFKISPDMIVLYRENERAEWKGFSQSLLAEMDKEIIPEVKMGAIVIEQEKTKKSEVFAKVLFSNTDLENEGVTNGDKIFIKPNLGVKFWIEGKEYFWIQNRHVIAKMN
jgi:co-chaperonin GroES (HSP10)